MAFDREALIGSLAAEFDKDKGLDVQIDPSNYIEPSKTLNCAALGLDIETLVKTRNVAQSFFNTFRAEADSDRVAAQKMMYMEVAIKCIDEIIAQKRRQ